MRDFLAAFTNTNGVAFPNTEAKNATSPSATDGTEFIKIGIDDGMDWGYSQALLDKALLTPNGLIEAVGASQKLESQEILFGLPLKYAAGFVLENAPDADHDIRVTPGIARAEESKEAMALDTAIVKQIDANWTPGGNVGGFPSALTLSANTVYHVFVIKKASTGAVEVGFDSALDAVNLLADTNAFTDYRRVGSVITDGVSNILPFTANEIGGGAVLYGWTATPADDKNGAIATVSRETIGLTVPTGYLVEAIFSVIDNGGGAGGSTLFMDLAIDDEAIHQSTGKLGQLATISSANRDGGILRVITDNSGQIGGRGQTAKTIRIQTVGWIDSRRT